jgi:hypothetical protein
MFESIQHFAIQICTVLYELLSMNHFGVNVGIYLAKLLYSFKVLLAKPLDGACLLDELANKLSSCRGLKHPQIGQVLAKIGLRNTQIMREGMWAQVFAQ